MSTPQLTRSALVLTPSPHIPREYGNRNRVFQTVNFLKSVGYNVSCLLYPFDEEWAHSVPSYYSALLAEFDYFSVIPNSKALHQGASEYHHRIDEWWDDNIGQHLSWLFRRKRFDLFFVNYTFFSKAFEFAPKGVFRVLDTHDVFTGRRELFEKFGVMPEFFYTNADEEKKAFDRADAVIAIKQSECVLLREMTTSHVISIPYWDNTADGPTRDRLYDEPRFSHERPLRVGFIGAHNSVNIINLQLFLRKMARYVAFYDAPIVIVVAGNVCRQLQATWPFVQLLGRVPDIADFYETIDGVIAPLEFSTGIKIKVGEALAWQLPVLATQNAFDGFQSFHSTQSEKSVDTVCESIVRLAFNEISYKQITLAARRSARAAEKAQERGFQQLRECIREATPKILFIIDRAFWHRTTYVDELTAQAIEYVSKIAPTIVVNLTTDPPVPFSSSNAISFVNVNSDADYQTWLINEAYLFRPIAAISHLLNTHNPQLRKTLNHHSIPSWHIRIHDGAPNVTSAYLVSDTRHDAIIISPLRYPPLLYRYPSLMRGIVVWYPNDLSEWENVVIRLIQDLSDRGGLPVQTHLVPLAAEIDTSFFSTSLNTAFDRWILYKRGAVAETFLQQIAKYLDIKILVLAETFLCPERYTAGSPSLLASLEAFITGEGGGSIAGGSDAGWSHLWLELDGRLNPQRVPQSEVPISVFVE